MGGILVYMAVLCLIDKMGLIIYGQNKKNLSLYIHNKDAFIVE